MNTRIIQPFVSTLVAGLLALGGLAAAQDMMPTEDYDWSDYQPFGEFETTYEAYDAADAGAIIFTYSVPSDQQPNFDVVGPDDYWEHFDFGGEFTLDGLAPGRYSVAATDEDLELAHTVVEVRAGEAVRVNATMGAWEEGAYTAGSFDPVTYYGAYEGYDDAYPGYPVGAYEVGPYEAYDVADAGALVIGTVPDGVDVVVTGPNGFSQGYESEALVEALSPGVYAIAASGAGTDLSVTTVEIQGGQQLSVTPGTTSMSGGAMSGDESGDAMSDETAMTGAGMNLYSSWDANSDSSVSVEEFQTGLYGTLAGEDGLLNEDEFATGFANLFGDGYSEEFAFNDFDADGDGDVTESEFLEAWNVDLFGDWDADGDSTITVAEFNQGWFDVIDANDDGVIGADEYSAYEPWFGYGYDEFGVGDEGIGQDAWMNFGA